MSEQNLKMLKEATEQERRPRMWWHWQNLNEKRNGKQGSGWRHGRCWWHFDGRPRGSNTIKFCWNFWSHFCGIEFDVDDEDITFMVAFPPVAFWLSISMYFWPLIKWPRRPLSANYPNTFVIDERECGIRIHSGRVWISPWKKTNEWVKADPWWARGVSFSINPFELVHMRHEVRCNDNQTGDPDFDMHFWEAFVGSWEHDKQPDHREIVAYPYRYTLKNGMVQERTAEVYVSRMAWRPRCFQWTSLFEKERTTIGVSFSDEVGERTGSWKGGTVGCGYELRPGETPEECLRRMECERKF
jgi:hypothetical protein